MDETMLPTTPSSGGEDVDETMMLPSAALRAGIAALPFTPPYPELDVDRYAVLSAEVQARGATDEVLARYHLASIVALAALKAEQERRFAADPAARARFDERVAHFLSFMGKA